MYKSLILPLFDYAEIIWDNCTNTQSNILENLHLEAIRIITGSARRATNPYHRRQSYERIIPFFRTEIYRNSFFPSTTLLWNNIPVNIQDSSSLSEFKRYLTNNDTKVPSYYYSGKRMEQIIDWRLRLEMSDLNFDLFNRHLTENQSCACGHPFETAEHFLLLRPNYHHIRRDTIMQIEDNYLDIQIFSLVTSPLEPSKRIHILKSTWLYMMNTVFLVSDQQLKYTRTPRIYNVSVAIKNETRTQCCLSWDWSWNTCLSLHAHTRTRIHNHTHTHTRAHNHTHTRAHTHTHTQAHARAQTGAHMHTRARKHALKY